ncbi:MAG: glycoside hydrolase family 3 protein [Candidatus Accumulibacter sp.]|uniref:glycoside hydrolase family 3 N-terminal domain-containing protein n=1 Tax=Accumulibacter sp. TaxID=2053492 RepID=UPI001AFEACD7|nr:glycoside hydrolase family 3 N-terminal domain-containing protein [Accumulibacter sp.]MBO3711410.1 glycoside hydrolase family 3 protein [Accumulibacter sp.]
MPRAVPRCWRSLLAWAALGSLLAVAWNLKHPLLYWLRPCETALLLAVAVLGGSAALRQPPAQRSPGRRRLLALGLLALAGLTLWRELEFHADRRHVLAGGRDLQMLGEHFIVGFRSFAEVEPLAARGLIGGIYLTRRNLLPDGVVTVAAGIAQLQEARRLAGLPPLIVAADQEGGPVAHLSPWLERLPALSSLVHAAPPETLAVRARLHGERQGASLAALGVNLNLAPVVDLRPSEPNAALAFLTGSGGRAIDDDPAVVTEVARAYVAGLADAGVGATLKHFPGLARVREDTHLRRASLAATTEDLRGDWQPFRSVGNGTVGSLLGKALGRAFTQSSIKSMFHLPTLSIAPSVSSNSPMRSCSSPQRSKMARRSSTKLSSLPCAACNRVSKPLALRSSRSSCSRLSSASGGFSPSSASI